MKSFFQRFHDSQPATSKSRTKDAAYKQRIPSSKPDKQRSLPSNGTEHPTKHHATEAAGPRSSEDTITDVHGHVGTGYSSRFSTFPGPSTNRHLPPNPSRSRTYPLDPSVSERKDSPPNDAKEKSRPSARRNEAPELSNHNGHTAFRVKTERPSQPNPPSPPPATQQPQLLLPEVQVESKEKRRKRERHRQVDENEGIASRPQQKPDSPDGEHSGTRRYLGNDREVEANIHRRLNQKEYRDQASGVLKESQQWEQQMKDMQKLQEREMRRKERLKLRTEKDDAEDTGRESGKERLEKDRVRVKKGASERGEAKEKARRDDRDRGKEGDRMLREEKLQRQELQKEREARERQIQLEQKDMSEKRDREREVKDERDRERRAKDERERDRRERKAKERQVERDREIAREQTEKEYKEKYERERQERQRLRERELQERQDREQAELERRELERLERDRITQKQLQARKDQELRQRETKPREIDILRADRERQERRKRDRQLWEQQREREREERERRWRGEQVHQPPEPILSETGAEIRSKKRIREGMSDSEREQQHVRASDRLASRTTTQANEPAEMDDARLVPNAGPPRRFDRIDEPSESQLFSKSALRSEEYTVKQKPQSQPLPPERNLSVPETPAVTALSSSKDIPPPVSSLGPPGYNPLGFPVSHHDIPPIERSGSTVPIKSASHPVSYSVVRVPGPESSKQIPEVIAPQVSRRRTTSNSQDRSTTQASRSTPSTQAQIPYSSAISSRPSPSTSTALEGQPQDIKILPPEISSVPSTGILPAPQGTPSSFQEFGSTGQGLIAAPSVTAAATTYLKAPGNHESPTQDNVIAHSFPTAQSVPIIIDNVAPGPPIPNQLSTTSNGFLAVPSFHHPVKSSGTKDDAMPSNKESPEYGKPRQKDSVPQAISLQPIPPVPASRPAAVKRRSNTVPGQYEPPADSMPSGDNVRTRESSGHAHNKIQNETRLDNTSMQPPTVLPANELSLQAAATLAEPQLLLDKQADRNNKLRPIQEVVPTVTPSHEESAHGKGYHTENHVTHPVPNDSRGVWHSRHQRYASENDVHRRGGKPAKYPLEGLSASNSQEPKQKMNLPISDPNHKNGNEKVAFRLPVDAPAIGTGSPDRKPQHSASEPPVTMGSMPQDQQQQGHHVTMSSSVPKTEYMTSTALIGNSIVRPGTAVPHSSITQPSNDTLPIVRTIVPPISHSHSQSVSRPHIDRPGTAIGLRQATEFRQEIVPQQMASEYSRSRTNSGTLPVPSYSNSTETHDRMRVDVPAQQSSYPVRDISSKITSQSTMAEANAKAISSKTGPAADTIQPIGESFPERSTQAHEDKPTTRSNTGSKTGGHGTAQQLSGSFPSYSEPVARKDDNGGSSLHPVQSRQRQQNSPHLQPEDNLLKVTGHRGPSTEDPRSAPYKSGQTQSTRRAEPMREGQSFLPIREYPTETDTPPSIQHPPVDDRGRGKYSANGYSPNALQRTPPTLSDSTPTFLPHIGHSKVEEGRPSRSQKNIVRARETRLAELPSQHKANDLPGQSYLRGARRNLASKLEQQQLDGSPNSASGNFLSNVENDTRLRTASNRDEHSPKYVGDSSPSISSKVSQSPDSRTRDYAYARTSPNTSQRNHSPRSKPVVVESQSQSGTQNRDEAPPHAIGIPMLQQSLRERQDHLPEVEGKHSRAHYQTSSYPTNEAGMRSSDTNQKIHIPHNQIPSQIQDPRPGRIISQRDGQRGDTRDAAQPISTTHSRSRSDSQIAFDNATSYPRYANNTPPHVASQNQTHVLLSSDHVRPSAPPGETLQRVPDQPSYSYSHQLNQPRMPREEVVVPQQVIQPPMIKPKRDTFEPLTQETQSQNPSSGPQPPTPKSFDIWLPPAPSRENRTSHRSTVTRTSHKDPGREREHARRSTTTPRTHQLSTSEPHQSTMDPRFARAYHYLKTRKAHTMSLVSVEAQDGAASTIIGSPTTSILSQVPINIPPEQDPIIAAREWTEAGAVTPGQRIRKPGLVWADPEDPPLNYQLHRPRSLIRRRTRSSGSRSREASDSDQPPPA